VSAFAVEATKVAIAMAAAALLFWGAWLRRSGRPDAFHGPRDAALAALAFAALLGSWNFLRFHYPGFVHADVVPYTLGAKYFPELGYTRLYECIAVADSEAGLGPRVARRVLTDLETYEVRGTKRILADPGRCTAHFAPERWADFERDVAWFRGVFAPEGWEDLQLDHGFNATPLWAALGALLATAPVSAKQVLWLASLDPILDLVAFAALVWAFGWRASAVVIVYWGTNRVAGFDWTGGAFLRHDWLAASFVALALLKKGFPLAAGILFGSAALLRAVPGVFFLGPALVALVHLVRTRRLLPGRELPRLAAGAAIAAALLLPLSALRVGADAWLEFAENLRHHRTVPASNTLGLRTALSFTHAGRFAVLLDGERDPGRAWKERRSAALAQRRALYVSGAAAWLVLCAFAASRQPLWIAAILGSGAIPFVLDGAGYYAAFLAAWGLLWLRRETVGAALCALAAVEGTLAALLVEQDDAFAATSIAVLAFVGLSTWLMATARAREAT
jgi:hypothetical protein